MVDAKQFTKFVEVLLGDDDNGVSEEVFGRLKELIQDNKELRVYKKLQDLMRQVDATDGRFYLP